MEKNVGATDGTARVVVGAVAGLLALLALGGAVPLPAVAAPALGTGALVLLVTGYTGFCGLYALLGVDTCSVDAR